MSLVTNSRCEIAYLLGGTFCAKVAGVRACVSWQTGKRGAADDYPQIPQNMTRQDKGNKYKLQAACIQELPASQAWA